MTSLWYSLRECFLTVCAVMVVVNVYTMLCDSTTLPHYSTTCVCVYDAAFTLLLKQPKNYVARVSAVRLDIHLQSSISNRRTNCVISGCGCCGVMICYMNGVCVYIWMRAFMFSFSYTILPKQN